MNLFFQMFKRMKKINEFFLCFISFIFKIYYFLDKSSNFDVGNLNLNLLNGQGEMAILQ